MLYNTAIRLLPTAHVSQKKQETEAVDIKFLRKGAHTNYWKQMTQSCQKLANTKIMCIHVQNISRHSKQRWYQHIALLNIWEGSENWNKHNMNRRHNISLLLKYTHGRNIRKSFMTTMIYIQILIPIDTSVKQLPVNIIITATLQWYI